MPLTLATVCRGAGSTVPQLVGTPSMATNVCALVAVQVCKWAGVGLLFLQLLELLMACGLQGAYNGAQEAAEDADEEAAWRRRPLLQQQARCVVPQ